MNHTVDTAFLDPEVVSQLGRIDLIAKAISDSLDYGVHHSRRRGFSTEFSDFKPYVPGDDLRLLDWRVYARTERLFVKRFEAETSVEVRLLLDASASMAWRWQQKISKLEYGANLLAALACVHMRQQDTVGLLVHDADDVHHLPPRSRRQHLDAIFAVLAALAPGEAEAFPAMIDTLVHERRHTGRIIVCADLEEDEHHTEEAIGRLAGLDDETILFHILDHSEVELPFNDVTHLQDAETGELLPVNLPAVKKAHTEAVHRFRAFWQQRCLDLGITYVPIHTGMNYADVIMRLDELP